MGVAQSMMMSILLESGNDEQDCRHPRDRRCIQWGGIRFHYHPVLIEMCWGISCDVDFIFSKVLSQLTLMTYFEKERIIEIIVMLC